MKKAGGGKAKGASFEREVCKRLSLWVSEGKHSDLLWRSAMSGGRATVGAKAGVRNRTQGGDISAVGELGHDLIQRWSVECKHVKTLDLMQAMLNRQGALMKYWRQTKLDASRQRKLPLLIARQNHFPVLVVFPTAHAAELGITKPMVHFPVEGGSISIALFEHMVSQPYPRGM
jgi:hypothetical protein